MGNNHPNRSRKRPKSSNPEPQAIIAARMGAGLLVRDAANIVHSSPTAWQDWESGSRKMHPGLWELFCIKTGAAS